MKAVSLFSGAGGMDVGFTNAGFEPIWANDLNKNACETYKKNLGDHIRTGDLDTLLDDLKETIKGQDISCVFGGPPCQGFSVAGKMDSTDPRSKLVNSFMNVVEIVKPNAFVMENVKALASLEKFKHIREQLIKKAFDLGYKVDLIILNSKDFGVPQSRERMFLIGFKDQSIDFNRFEIELSKYKKNPPTLKETLLSVGVIGSESNNRICKAKITFASNPIMRKSPYAGMLFNGQGRPLNLNGHSATLPASMGGNRTPIVDNDALYEDKPNWIEEYHAHLMEGQQPLEFEHNQPNLRRLTVDEAIAIQTFPREYVFSGPQSSIFSQIGNAVPCKLAEAVARTVIDIIKK